MGAGYHGGFGKTKGNTSHNSGENIENNLSQKECLIDKKLVSEMEKNKVKFKKEKRLTNSREPII